MDTKTTIDNFLKISADMTEEGAAKYRALRGGRDKELALWHHWNDTGRKPEHLEPLLKSLDPYIRSEASKRISGLGGSIPRAALHNELRNTALRAIGTYDPSRGQLTTHISSNFRAVSDFIASNRNEKYMPKDDVESYQHFQNAKNELAEELGREPSPAELHGRLPEWTPKKIKKMTRGFGPEAYTDMGTEFEEAATLRPHDAFQLVKGQLKPVEQEFAALHFPAEGSSMSIQHIAKQLKISPHRAYRIKAIVERKMAPILKGE